MHLASPNCTAQWMPSLWKFLDALNRFPCFVAELDAKAHAPCIVVLDEPEAKTVFSNSLSQLRKNLLGVNRAKFTGVVSGQAVFRFFEPESVERRVGFIETENKRFH